MNQPYYPPLPGPEAPKSKRPLLALLIVAIGAAILILIVIATAAAGTSTRTSGVGTTTAVPTAMPVTYPPVPPWGSGSPAVADPYVFDRSTYEQLSARDFAMLLKDPNSRRGAKLLLYGSVTQFDTVTGPNGFRAGVAAQQQDSVYGYQQNAWVTGAPSTLTNVVEGDTVRMYVSVAGSTTYETALTRGSLTVPLFQVSVIDVLP